MDGGFARWSVQLVLLGLPDGAHERQAISVAFLCGLVPITDTKGEESTTTIIRKQIWFHCYISLNLEQFAFDMSTTEIGLRNDYMQSAFYSPSPWRKFQDRLVLEELDWSEGIKAVKDSFR